ncbi:hypothetical protein [Jiangella alba]|uniref:DUF3558 domain-containing protein n=1 Tax=Jiangella alba TaxID=561176 RepID=A0A1H5LXC7_9ACTN|nr:hypothetical protein [Jiangella alba]SEE81147.1 hypothetical protein SAMN04488561_2797 [Jiangella alba]
MSSAARATRLALVLAVAVLAPASCSSGSEPGSGATPAGDEESASSVLEDLTADDFCALLPAESVERALGVVVEGSEGTERGRAPVMRTPYFLSRECDYSSGLPALNTRLATEWDEDDTDADVLDRAFTDIVSETVGAYEDVPGLGVAAAFGPNPMLATADVATGTLEVVLRAGDERLLLSVYTTGRATLDQLRPLAEELIAGLGY